MNLVYDPEVFTFKDPVRLENIFKTKNISPPL